MDTDRTVKVGQRPLKHKELTDKVIKALKVFNIVYNCLGYVFLEAVYEQTTVIELAKPGVRA
jgi:hypothetical protein